MKTYGKSLENYPNKLTMIGPANNDVQAIMHANGVYNKRDMDWYNRFVRFPGADPENALVVAHEYLFFTKPDLHLINTINGSIADSLSKYSFFVDALDRYRPICEQLQFSARKLNKNYTITNTQNPFATILTNTVTNSLDIPPLESENDQETGANVYGTKITYRGNSYTSDQDCSFSLEFEDTKYLEIYMFFKIYDEYCRMKNLGLIELDYNNDDDIVWINYTLNKVLHDQFSVYKFVVGEDGMTLIYWGKYTGVYPTGAPRDSFSDMGGNGGQKLTVNFKAQFFRDMDPSILSEFNSVAIGNASNPTSYYNKAELNLFNENLGMMEPTWSSMPHIAKVTNRYDGDNQISKMMRYRLLWKA